MKAPIYFCVIILTSILFSSCGVGNHGSISFSKRKYTTGHFSAPVAKVKTLVPAETLTKQVPMVSISKAPVNMPGTDSKTITKRVMGSPFFNHVNSIVQAVSRRPFVQKLPSDNIETESPGHIGGIPGHGGNSGQPAFTTDYGEAGLALTVLPFAALVIAFLVALSTDETIATILLILSGLSFLIGFILNIMGLSKHDKHQGDAIAGFVIDVLVVLIFFIAILSVP